MSKIKSVESLEIWKMARQQAQEVYELTAVPHMDFKFARQANGSSGSVMDNIAEGFNWHSNREFVQYLVIARGSNGEVRSQRVRMFDQKLLCEDELEIKLRNNEVLGRKLTTLIKYLKKSKLPQG